MGILILPLCPAASGRHMTWWPRGRVRPSWLTGVFLFLSVRFRWPPPAAAQLARGPLCNTSVDLLKLIMGRQAATWHERNAALSLALRRGNSSHVMTNRQLSIPNRSRYVLLKPLTARGGPAAEDVEDVLKHRFAGEGLETTATLIIKHASGGTQFSRSTTRPRRM